MFPLPRPDTSSAQARDGNTESESSVSYLDGPPLLQRDMVLELRERNYFALHPPNFASLGHKYSFLRPHLRYYSHPSNHSGDPEERASLDLSSHMASLTLSRALFSEYLGLDLDLPPTNLPPPLPRCLNYLHFARHLQEAALATQILAAGGQAPGRGAGTRDSIPDAVSSGLQAASDALDSAAPRPLLLDVGCGASAAFSLIAARMYRYSGAGVDVDPVSVARATENVARNGGKLAGYPASEAVGEQANHEAVSKVCGRSDETVAIGEGIAVALGDNRGNVFSGTFPCFPNPPFPPPASTFSETSESSRLPDLPRLPSCPVPAPDPDNGGILTCKRLAQDLRRASTGRSSREGEGSSPRCVSVIGVRPFSVTVCNPPFFDSRDPDVTASLPTVSSDPPAVSSPAPGDDSGEGNCFSSGVAPGESSNPTPIASSVVYRRPHRPLSATASELCCPGGESTFTRQMAVESAANPLGALWFTCMLGKKQTMPTLLRALGGPSAGISAAAAGCRLNGAEGLREKALAALEKAVQQSQGHTQAVQAQARAGAGAGAGDKRASEEEVCTCGLTSCPGDIVSLFCLEPRLSHSSTCKSGASVDGAMLPQVSPLATSQGCSCCSYTRTRTPAAFAAAVARIRAEMTPESARDQPGRAPMRVPVPFPLVQWRAFTQGEQTRWAVGWSWDPLLCVAVAEKPREWAAAVAAGGRDDRSSQEGSRDRGRGGRGRGRGAWSGRSKRPAAQDHEF